MKPILIPDLDALKRELPMLKPFNDFDLFAPSLVVAENYARTYIVGAQVYDLLTPDSELHRLLRGYVSSFAGYTVLPQLDVNISQIGISVINNETSAPASAQRVAALYKQLTGVSFGFLEQIDRVLLLEYADKFLATPAARRITTSLVHDAPEMEYVYYPDKSLHRYENYLAFGKQATHYANTIIAGAISSAVLQCTLKNTYPSPQEGAHETLRHYLLDVLSSIFSGDIPMRNRLLSKVISFVCDNEADFPEFIGTAEYKKTKAPVYENKSEDTAYWGV